MAFPPSLHLPAPSTARSAASASKPSWKASIRLSGLPQGSRHARCRAIAVTVDGQKPGTSVSPRSTLAVRPCDLASAPASDGPIASPELQPPSPLRISIVRRADWFRGVAAIEGPTAEPVLPDRRSAQPLVARLATDLQPKRRHNAHAETFDPGWPASITNSKRRSITDTSDHGIAQLLRRTNRHLAKCVA